MEKIKKITENDLLNASSKEELKEMLEIYKSQNTLIYNHFNFIFGSNNQATVKNDQKGNYNEEEESNDA